MIGIWLIRRPSARTPLPRRARLRLEHLEDRSVPSTFTVNTTLDEVTPADGKLSLREAITKANTTAGADVIVLPAGVFKIALAGAGEDANATGDFDISDALTIQGAGAGVSIVDGQRLDRAFDILENFPSKIKVVIQGLTVRNGSADNGGGIMVGTADLVVRDCAVTGNRASTFGGGVTNVRDPAGTVTLVRTTVARNVAGDGGGLFLINGTGSALIVKDSTIRRNTADDGGGIDTSTVTLTNSTVSGNVAIGGDGGGIKAGTVTLTNSTISGNTASQRGGGINALTATLTNSTISGNTAVIEGGGVFSTSASLLNCTVVENIAGTGGGLFHVAGGTFSVRNTIVALNLVAFGGNGPDAFGASFTSQGHNLIGDGTGSNGFTVGIRDIVGTNANPIDPKLGPLQNNGGLTQTMALKFGSLAIDHGDNAILPPTDQRGFPRKKDGNFDGIAIVDIGAFER